ncbi:hypothetical protein [Streptomyces sp. NPDC058855]|uniref:hypothetical protein n=1 Tax=Streptomyces sp. NPDC058855 TaxID=3346651 RepID=UPI0036ACE4C1
MHDCTCVPDPLLRGLHEDGARATASGLLAVDPADGRVLQRDGRPTCGASPSAAGVRSGVAGARRAAGTAQGR